MLIQLFQFRCLKRMDVVYNKVGSKLHDNNKERKNEEQDVRGKLYTQRLTKNTFSFFSKSFIIII